MQLLVNCMGRLHVQPETLREHLSACGQGCRRAFSGVRCQALWVSLLQPPQRLTRTLPRILDQAQRRLHQPGSHLSARVRPVRGGAGWSASLGRAAAGPRPKCPHAPPESPDCVRRIIISAAAYGLGNRFTRQQSYVDCLQSRRAISAFGKRPRLSDACSIQRHALVWPADSLRMSASHRGHASPRGSALLLSADCSRPTTINRCRSNNKQQSFPCQVPENQQAVQSELSCDLPSRRAT